MASFKHLESRLIEDAFEMRGGNVLDFVNRTFAEFFEEVLHIDIYDTSYSDGGSSKANHLRSFLRRHNESTVAKVIRELWEHRESVPSYCAQENHETLKAGIFKLLQRLEASDTNAPTDAIDRFAHDQTLDELVVAIERDIAADKPVAALDRLHTYCMKKFGHLLDVHKIEWNRSEPLHSRVGKYIKSLNEDRELTDVSNQIIKGSMAIFDKFNHVRNNESLAHDNKLLDPAEARYIYDSVHALLRFVKSIESGRFGA